MATNFKKPSKKTAIIAAILVVALLTVAITGTVIFLKDRGTTEAAGFETEQANRQENGTVANNNHETQQNVENEVVEGTQPENGQIANDQNANGVEGTETATTTQGTVGTTGTAGNAGTRANNGTTATTDNIQETTITDYQTIVTEPAWKEQGVTWTPISVNAQLPKINAELPDFDVTKTATTESGEEIAKKGEEITYTITATSNKELEGIEIKDVIPEQTEFVSADNEGRPVKSEEVVKGIVWNVDLKEKNSEGLYEKQVKLTVKVSENAEGTVTNIAIANGKKSNEVETPIFVEPKVQVIPTKTELKPQKAIVVLDFSSSMIGEKIKQLKIAVNKFIDNFIDANSKNEIMLIEYDENIINGTPYAFTNDRVALKTKLASDKITGSGTNTDLGLTIANQELVKLSSEDISSTSIILMSDGSPTYYFNDDLQKTEECRGIIEPSRNRGTGREEAKKAAMKIIGKGVPIYTVGFQCDFDANTLMSDIARANGGDLDKYYSEAKSGEDLNIAFTNIAKSITIDGEPIDIQTKNGKMKIEEEFKGQNVEIYTKKPTEGVSTLKETFEWNAFTNLTTVNEDGTITFDLIQYMKDNNIDVSEKITIRFVDPQNDSQKMKSAGLVSLVIDATEEAESEEDIAEYEQKIEKVEKAKTALVEKDSKTETNTINNNTTNSDLTNNNTVVDNKEDSVKPNTDDQEDDKNNTIPTEKTEDTTDTTTEEASDNNQIDNTDSTITEEE